MFRKTALPLLILATALAIMVLLFAMRPAAKKSPRSAKPVLVETLTAHAGAHQVWLESQGAVTPLRQSTLTARVSGTVIETAPFFLRGGFFHKGDVLLRLDPTDMQVALTRAEASLASRKAQLAAELAKAEQARRDWQAGGKGKPSPLVLRQPYVDEARAAVKAAEADLAQARANLERTVIRAPYDGLVLEKNVDLGQFVNMGVTLGRIAATDVAEVRLPLTESELAMLPLEQDHPTRPVAIRLRLQQGEQRLERMAFLHRTEAVADDKTRVIYAVARVEDPYLRRTDSTGDLLRFGSFVRALLPGKTFPQSFELPRHVLDIEGRLPVVDEQMRLQLRPVHVVAEYRGKILIDQGLRDGEAIVLTPIPAAVEGMALRLAAPDGESAAMPAAASRPEPDREQGHE